jgi:hypothetical protein
LRPARRCRAGARPHLIPIGHADGRRDCRRALTLKPSGRLAMVGRV